MDTWRDMLELNSEERGKTESEVSEHKTTSLREDMHEKKKKNPASVFVFLNIAKREPTYFFFLIRKYNARVRMQKLHF